MKILGLPLGTNGLNAIAGNSLKKTNLDASVKKGDTGDSTKPVSVKDVYDTRSYAVEPDYTLRTDAVESAAQNVSNGAYSRPSVLVTIAEKLIENGIASDITDVVSETPVRGDKVDEAITNILDHFYYNPNIMQEIADRLILDLGLSSFRENAKD